MTGFGKQSEKEKNNFPRRSKVSGEALHKKALDHHIRGDLVNAEKAYREAISNGYLHQGVFSNLGVIYKNSGRPAEAIILYKKAIEASPNHPDAYSNLGNLYKDLGNLDQALDSTLKSLELKPDNPDAHMSLGGIYKALGNLDQALDSTLKSLELKPDNHEAHMNLGSIYTDLGNPDQALVSTLKSLEINPDNHEAHMNLGGIYKDLGNLDQALASTLKSLELKPDNPDTQLNLANIYKDLGNLDQNLKWLREAKKSERTREKAAISLAETHYCQELYREGVDAISGINNKSAKNLLLSLYLCLDEKIKFNRCADDLVAKRWLNERGIAAIDHANILYNQKLDNGLSQSTIDSIFVQTINQQEFSDAWMEEILISLSNETLQPRPQSHLVNGLQTSGNILEIPKKPFQELKKILIQKIDTYNQLSAGNIDKDFQTHWREGMYTLSGWAIIMSEGGNLKSHNHESGWLTGTFYLQMPERNHDSDEGAIEFSHQGPKYPKGDSVFIRRTIRPQARDLNIFSSSLFHRTLPFQSKTQRICIAFDIQKNEEFLG